MDVIRTIGLISRLTEQFPDVHATRNAMADRRQAAPPAARVSGFTTGPRS